MEFKDRVHRYRMKHNLNQEQFAELVGLDRTYISSIENGKKPGKNARTKIELVIGGETE